MRRSEDRLEFWLAGGRRSRRFSRSSWASRLRIRLTSARAQEMPLQIDARLGCGDDSLPVASKVIDGLGAFTALDATADDSRGAALAAVQVCSEELLGGAAVSRLSMPDPHRTRVGQARLFMPVRIKTADASLSAARVGSADPLGKPRVLDKEVGWSSGVRSWGSIAGLPHLRRSVDINALAQSERESYLREAEVLKHIPHGRAELVAVFCGVPIELISRLRFLAERREILFTIAAEPQRTVARLHNIAVVRDTGGGEIYLVPHRTYSRLAALT